MLMLFAFWLWGYLGLSHHFENTEDLKEEVQSQRMEIERQRLRASMAQYEQERFQQYVATLMSNKLKSKDYVERRVASVVTKEIDSSLKLVSGESLISKAKRDYQNQKWESAKYFLVQFCREFPLSELIPEAKFLLVETNYKLRDYFDAIQVAQELVQLFPDSEMTGYAMLRVGQIFIELEKFDDAEQVFQTVEASFNQGTLRQQAREFLRGLHP